MTRVPNIGEQVWMVRGTRQVIPLWVTEVNQGRHWRTCQPDHTIDCETVKGCKMTYIPLEHVADTPEEAVQARIDEINNRVTDEIARHIKTRAHLDAQKEAFDKLLARLMGKS